MLWLLPVAAVAAVGTVAYLGRRRKNKPAKKITGTFRTNRGRFVSHEMAKRHGLPSEPPKPKTVKAASAMRPKGRRPMTEAHRAAIRSASDERYYKRHPPGEMWAFEDAIQKAEASGDKEAARKIKLAMKAKNPAYYSGRFGRN